MEVVLIGKGSAGSIEKYHLTMNHQHDTAVRDKAFMEELTDMLR